MKNLVTNFVVLDMVIIATNLAFFTFCNNSNVSTPTIFVLLWFAEENGCFSPLMQQLFYQFGRFWAVFSVAIATIFVVEDFGHFMSVSYSDSLFISIVTKYVALGWKLKRRFLLFRTVTVPTNFLVIGFSENSTYNFCRAISCTILRPMEQIFGF